MYRLTKKQIFGGVLGIVAFLVFYFLPATELMSHLAWVAIGTVVTGVCFALFGTMPEFVAMLFMPVAWTLTGCCTFNVAFSTWAGTSLWLVIAGMVIGGVMQKTGLLSRITLGMMQLLPGTFKGQTLGLLLAGYIVNPLVPSTSAKSVICSPLAKGISDEMGYKPHSNGARGLFIMFYIGFITVTCGFLSASFLSYTVVGLQPDAEKVGWVQWFLYALPWTVLVGVLMLLFVWIRYKPSENVRLTKADLKARYDGLGAWTGQQKFVLVVMIVCMVFWILERKVGISSTLVSLVACILFFTWRIFDKNDYKSFVSWDNVTFIGSFISMSTIFSSLGINDAINALLNPVLGPLISKPFIFFPVLCIVIYVCRFVLVSWTASLIIFCSLLIPLGAANGISSFAICFAVYSCVNVWTVAYQNQAIVAAKAMTKDEMCDNKTMITSSVAFMVVNMIAVEACVPLWMIIGLIK